MTEYVPVTDLGMVKRGDLSIGVIHHPRHKRPAVVVQRGSVLYTCAYCRNEEEAVRLWEALLEIAGAR